MFEPRVALASLSGESDHEWARRGEGFAGAAFLGGIALDGPSRDAAREMVADRDRTEFLPPDPLGWIDDELAALAGADLRPAVNVRSATAGPVREAGRICAEHDAILEVNAHCRQAELCDVGCGETLLRDTDRLAEYVAAASETGALVSVKVRAEVPGIDLPETARALAAAGADAVHVDAMDSEGIIAEVADAAPDTFLVANNGVRNAEAAREYFAYGADAVSVGRPSDDPCVLRQVRRAVDEWFSENSGEGGGGGEEGGGRPRPSASGREVRR
ncbi:tRNA-dihydrouridine synthase [Halorarum halophilum]|uniref:tRNA-dihydrouridine synthase n=1 Tax=Halorarum halophilum TaxID=2743090 RepID=A0A7D5GG83_9EURY|nr:tRNA-dihydrouridine synthase [Halobaculum halophilum]QLG26591.1 tRNA-dihydrouridine synthase [Halobaculum halophilum]